MNATFHITGITSAALYLLSVIGLWIQLQKILERKRNPSVTHPTAVISLNFISMAFGAFFFLFVYGFALHDFNHYLVWPRLSAMAVSLAIMYQIMVDRKDLRSRATFVICSTATALGLGAFIFMEHGTGSLLLPSTQVSIVLVTLTLIQANAHQILLIVRSGSTGGIALRSHQLTFVKDVGTLALGFAMGTETGWPLIVLCGSNALLKLAVMYLFRWVHVSPTAQRRRGPAPETAL